MAGYFKRVVLIVLDGFGVGESPDAQRWGDQGADTLGHILESQNLNIPNLISLGLGAIRPSSKLVQPSEIVGCYGKCNLKSNGKDSTTGHWEMAGIVLEKAHPTYPQGFPPKIIDAFIKVTNVPGILGNKPASGTEIIQELGEEHLRSGKPIIYTSADSVFQIAAHEDVIPLNRLYSICVQARAILTGEDEVGRVIARPFTGEPGKFTRTENRHDYAISPPSDNLLTALQHSGYEVISVGKISSIFNDVGISKTYEAKNNHESIEQTITAIKREEKGLIFSNLVDFDMLYGHRRDPVGYAKALEHFDSYLPEIESLLTKEDLLVITSDHGNDPGFKGSDHTAEYVPLLAFGPGALKGQNLGTRDSLADIGQTIAENFGLKLSVGKSFLSNLS